MKLYEIAAEYAALEDAADLTPEEHAAALAALDGELAAKIQACVTVVLNLDAEVEAIATAQKRLAERKAQREGAVERLRAYMRATMDLACVPKIRTPLATVSVRDGAEHVEIVDETALPDEYVHEELVRKVDKGAILKAYREHGECVPGTTIARGSRVLTVRA